MNKNKKWTSSEIKKLLKCKTDKDFMRAFPGRKISTLQRKQRYYKQNGNKLAKPKKDIKDVVVEKAREKEIQKLRARKTVWEIIGEQFISSAKTLPPGKIPPLIKVGKTRPEDEEEICTMFSDPHVGLTVDAKESGGLGSYGVNVFHEKMNFFKVSQSKIFRIVRHNTPYNVHNVFMLGDIIENRVMREAQLRLTEINVVEQVMEAVDKIALWIGWLAQQFHQVNVYCVVGQHGRLMRDKSIMSPMDNLDYLIYHWCAERLKEHKNVKFNISDSWWMGVERMDVRFYVEHGDEFFSWLGIPFYGLKRGKANIRELLRQYLDEKGRPVDFDYFLVGHIHVPSDFQGIITGGSWAGGTEYSLKKLKAGEPASQKMFSIHPIFKKTWSRDILLQDPRKQPRIKFYK